MTVINNNRNNSETTRRNRTTQIHSRRSAIVEFPEHNNLKELMPSME